MVIWSRFIITLLRVTPFPFVIPLAFIFLTAYFFGFNPQSVLLLILLFQFYIIWLQAEIALRQTRMQELTYDPLLIARAEAIYADSKIIGYTLKLKNIGSYPEYNALIYLSPNVKKQLNELKIPEPIKGILNKNEEVDMILVSNDQISKTILAPLLMLSIKTL